MCLFTSRILWALICLVIFLQFKFETFSQYFWSPFLIARSSFWDHLSTIKVGVLVRYVCVCLPHILLIPFRLLYINMTMSLIAHFNAYGRIGVAILKTFERCWTLCRMRVSLFDSSGLRDVQLRCEFSWQDLQWAIT